MSVCRKSSQPDKDKQSLKTITSLKTTWSTNTTLLDLEQNRSFGTEEWETGDDIAAVVQAVYSKMRSR